MLDVATTNYHVQYFSFAKHWCHRSEKFAGVDALLTAIDQKWSVGEVVYLEEHWHAGSRRVAIYHFSLKRGSETMTMPVIDNPMLGRLLLQSKARLVEIQVSEKQRVENTGS